METKPEGMTTMAGDWIKVEITTPDKPEVFEMAEALNLPPDEVLGKLIRVWIWADQHTRDGNAPSVTKALLDRYAAVTGFAAAMISVGWLLESGGRIQFPHFDRHNGKTAKTRALGAKRTQSHRSGNASVTQPPLQDRDSGVTDSLPEKRREEIEKKAPPADSRIAEPQTTPSDFPDHPSEVVIPPKVDTPDCRRAMAEWQRHLDVSAAPNAIVPGSPQEQYLWQWAARMGPDKWIQSVEYTIAQGGFRLLEKWDTPQFAKGGGRAKAADASTDPVWMNVLSVHQKTDDSPKGRAERNERLTPAEREAGMQVQMRTRLPNMANDWDRKQLAAEFIAALRMIQDRDASKSKEFEDAFK